MATHPLCFWLPAEVDAQSLFDALGPGLKCQIASRRSGRLRWLDTHRRSLLADGGIAEFEPDTKGHLGRLVWRDLGSAHSRLRLRGVAWPIDASALAGRRPSARLAERMAGRALLPLLEVDQYCEQLDCRNADGKTVLRLELRAIGGRDEGRTLLLRPLRGYADDADTAALRIGEITGVQACGEDPFIRMARAAGVTTCAPSAPASPKLRPRKDAASQLGAMAAAMVEPLRMNALGVRETPYDLEFLHELRVTVRRVRAILIIARDCLNRKQREKLASELAWLQRAAGPARDLDVQRLDIEPMRARLDAGLQSTVDAYAAHLDRARSVAQGSLERVLGSRRFERLLGLLAGLEALPKTGETLRDCAARRLGRRYRRIAKDIRELDDEAPDESWHRLRSRARMLRYGLEALQSLCDGAAMADLIRPLRGLQSDLGRYQDCVVERARLELLAVQHPQFEALARAMNQLLASDQVGARERANQRIVHASHTKLRKRLRRCFG